MAPRDKLENGVYILKSAARPWLPIQIGDIVDPETKARKSWVNNSLTELSFSLCLSLIVTVEEIDENNKAKHVGSLSPVFCSYFISNSGSWLIKIMVHLVMVTTLSNHRARGLLAITLLPLIKLSLGQNWAWGRTWSGGPDGIAMSS